MANRLAIYACGATFALLASSAAAGPLGERAKQCATFNLGNWDYEVATFSPEDRSDGWIDQAAAFIAVAERDGLSAVSVDLYIKEHRGDMKAMITNFVQLGDAKSRKTHRALSRQCDKIIRKEPELAPFR